MIQYIPQNDDFSDQGCKH